MRGCASFASRCRSPGSSCRAATCLHAAHVPMRGWPRSARARSATTRRQMPSRRSTHPPAEAERLRRAARRRAARRKLANRAERDRIRDRTSTDAIGALSSGSKALAGSDVNGRDRCALFGEWEISGRSQRDRTARWAATRDTEAVDGASARVCAAQTASAAARARATAAATIKRQSRQVRSNLDTLSQESEATLLHMQAGKGQGDER